MSEKVFETENWAIEHNEEEDIIRVSRFEDGHWYNGYTDLA